MTGLALKRRTASVKCLKSHLHRLVSQRVTEFWREINSKSNRLRKHNKQNSFLSEYKTNAATSSKTCLFCTKDLFFLLLRHESLQKF